MKNKKYRIPYGFEMWVNSEVYLYNQTDYFYPKSIRKHASISMYSDEHIITIVKGTYKEFKMVIRQVEISKSI